MRMSPAGLATLAAERHLPLQAGIRAAAIARLVAAADRQTEAVLAAVAVDIGQNELDALVMLRCDLGARAFARSTVVRRLNAGARRAAADAFLLCGGHAPRRRRQRALFLAAAEPTDRLGGCTAAECALIGEYDRLAHGGTQEERRLALRAQLTEQRKRIWCAAQASGWDVANRAERYRRLLARTS